MRGNNMKTPFLSSFCLSGFRSAVRFSPKNLVPEILNWLALVVCNCRDKGMGAAVRRGGCAGGRRGCARGRRGHFPGLLATTRREGALMVPPIPTSLLWLVPTARTTRRRGFPHTASFLFFLMPPKSPPPMV